MPATNESTAYGCSGFACRGAAAVCCAIVRPSRRGSGTRPLRLDGSLGCSLLHSTAAGDEIAQSPRVLRDRVQRRFGSGCWRSHRAKCQDP